jgi:hypothetical protein
MEMDYYVENVVKKKKIIIKVIQKKHTQEQKIKVIKNE